MLLKSKITQIEMLSDEWRLQRLFKFTSSKWYLLMGERGLGEQGLTYIRSKVGEFLSGVSSEVEFENDSTRHGNLYEVEGIKEFAKLMKIEFLVLQKLIHEQGSMTSSTPDALWVRKESTDKLSYDVSTIEIKAFQNTAHVKMAECETPSDIKKAYAPVFWQIIHQMEECDCLTGYAVFYNPNFKVGGLRVIEFRKAALLDEFRLLKERKKLALETFEKIKNKLLNIKN